MLSSWEGLTIQAMTIASSVVSPAMNLGLAGYILYTMLTASVHRVSVSVTQVAGTVPVLTHQWVMVTA